VNLNSEIIKFINLYISTLRELGETTIPPPPPLGYSTSYRSAFRPNEILSSPEANNTPLGLNVIDMK